MSAERQLTDPLNTLERLRAVEEQLHRLRYVTATLSGSLSYWVEHPDQWPSLDLSAARDILRATYQCDLTEAEARELASRSLWTDRCAGGAR